MRGGSAGRNRRKRKERERTHFTAHVSRYTTLHNTMADEQLALLAKKREEVEEKRRNLQRLREEAAKKERENHLAELERRKRELLERKKDIAARKEQNELVLDRLQKTLSSETLTRQKSGENVLVVSGGAATTATAAPKATERKCFSSLYYWLVYVCVIRLIFLSFFCICL